MCFARPINPTNPRPSARRRSRRAYGTLPLGTPPPNNCPFPLFPTSSPRSTSGPSHPATHFTQHPQSHLARTPCSRRVPQFRALRPGRSWVWDEERASASSSFSSPGAAAVAAALLPELAQGPPPPRPHGRLPPLPSSAGRRAETRRRGCGRSARGSSDPRPHSRCSPLAPPRSPRARVRPSQPERKARTRAGATPLRRARGGCGREAREGDLSRGTWREGARPAGDAGRSGYRLSQALVLRAGFACPSCGKPGSGSRAKREGTANEWGRVRVPDSQKAR